MNQSNRALLIGMISLVFLCFLSGVFLSRRNVRPPLSPTPSPTSLQDPDFSAPHKVDPVKARKTPVPQERPEPVHSPGRSTLSYWVYQDGTLMQAGPGLNHPLVQKLNFGTRLSVLEEGEEWLHVQVPAGRTGWVRRNAIGNKPPPGVPGVSPKDALKTLEAYFAALNAHDYEKAYDQLSYEFKRALPYRTFAAGYAGVESAHFRVVRVQTLAHESTMFQVEMITYERPRPRGFQGEYVLVLEGDHWRIGQADMREVDPRSIPPFPNAVAPIQPAFPDPTGDPEEE